MSQPHKEGTYKLEKEDHSSRYQINLKAQRKRTSNVSRRARQESSVLNSGSESNDGKKKVGRWTEEEDIKLQHLIEEYGEKSWRNISDMMEGRSAIQCLHRWTKILKPGLRKGPWQEEEDEKLLEWVKNNGPCKWSLCAENIQGRSGKQCRERWFNNLNPNVKKGGWTQQEDQEIFRGYLQYSSSWSKIARNLSGRTENSVKNRFYSTVRKLLADQEKEGGTGTIRNPPSGAALQSFVREQLIKIGGMKPGEIIKPEVDESQNSEDDEEIFHDEKDQQLQSELGGKSELEYDEDSKMKRKLPEGYPEQNLLYRLLKQQGGPIKRTSCMKDYSTIYKKYKKRYNQKKKEKKASDKADLYRKLLIKSQNENIEFSPLEKPEKKTYHQKATKDQDIKLEQSDHYSIPQSKRSNRIIQQQQHNQHCQLQYQQQIQPQVPLTNEKMAEFNRWLQDLFNQYLAQVKNAQSDLVKNNAFQQPIPPPHWQMILASTDARIIYPPANMPPNMPIQIQAQHPEPFSNEDAKRERRIKAAKKKGNILPSQKKVKVEEPPPQAQQNDNLVNKFFQKFNHLGQIGISQIGVQQPEKQVDKNFQNQMIQDNKIDQKMLFLISQLHSLETMLSNTKKELGRLEASLHEKINVQNNSCESESSFDPEKRVDDM